MMKFIQNLLVCGVMVALIYTVVVEARPPNALGDNNEGFDNVQPDVDEARKSYYDLTAQSIYPNVQLDPLQYLIAQYRPNAYLRSPNWSNLNDLYRMPESKRQVRYRQCYFNPISCFKK